RIVARTRARERRCQISAKVKRRTSNLATARAARGPGRESPPNVRACLKRRDGRNVSLRWSILQVAGKKRREDLLSKIQPGVAVKVQRAERACVFDLLPVVPRTENQEHFVVIHVLSLQRFVDRDRSVDVLLVPQTVHQHDWYL